MSPFMSGLLIGMTIFSALSLQWAKQELTESKRKQAEEAQTQAQDLAGAMEFAVLSENANEGQDYDETYTLERARRFSNAVGVTRGGNDALVTARSSEEQGVFGIARTQVALTNTDDTLQRAEINRVGNAEDLNRAVGNKTPAALFDAGGARQQQVLTSTRRMEVMAEQLYAFYSAQMRFPNGAEFTSLDGGVDLKDSWGRSFMYLPDDDGQGAELSFSTPWGHTQSLRVSLQDDTTTPTE